MKFLIYSFKSYKHWKKNITEQILEKINGDSHVVKTIFPLKCNKKLFLKTIKNVMPDIIIGLGQHENGDKFRIERKAVNLKRKNLNSVQTPIFVNKPHHYFLSLMLKEDEESRYCYDAGDDVSNYSMYVISHLCKNINFAFIHIPKDADVEKAAAFVERKISESTKSHVLEGEQSGLSNYFKKNKEISRTLNETFK